MSDAPASPATLTVADGSPSIFATGGKPVIDIRSNGIATFETLQNRDKEADKANHEGGRVQNSIVNS